MDVHSKETRHYNMSMIRGKNTKPEIIVRSYLFSRGFRYRINVKKLPGTPDIVLKKYKTVIFINGCFWHGHNGCRKFVLPKTNTEWWLNKIKTNQLRDQQQYNLLENMDWCVIVIWECSLHKNYIRSTLENLEMQIKKGTK
ncbi:very short patch repair endonuclease [Alistipes sp.]|uniref:very short patch repair endonuclease n=1 Tax=Alistipes sp. TaxID=1872444 RepID=UPI0011DDCC3D|nr:very short patch repair endonuclease [Alistipes sp.]